MADHHPDSELPQSFNKLQRCQIWTARSPGMLHVLRDHHRELLLHLGFSVAMAQLQPDLDRKLTQLSSFCMRQVWKIMRVNADRLTGWARLCLIEGRILSSSSTETLNQVESSWSLSAGSASDCTTLCDAWSTVSRPGRVCTRQIHGLVGLAQWKSNQSYVCSHEKVKHSDVGKPPCRACEKVSPVEPQSKCPEVRSTAAEIPADFQRFGTPLAKSQIIRSLHIYSMVSPFKNQLGDHGQTNQELLRRPPPDSPKLVCWLWILFNSFRIWMVALNVALMVALIRAKKYSWFPTWWMNQWEQKASSWV